MGTTEDRRRRLVCAALVVVGAVVLPVIFGLHLRQVPAGGYADRDDAVITLSHARNLVEYGFVGVSPSGERIEGFSAPLQFVIAAAIYAIAPFDYSTFFRWQTRIGGIALGALFAFLLASYDGLDKSRYRTAFAGLAIIGAAQILASSSAFLWWHASGMENVYKCVALLALLAALDMMLRKGRVSWPVALVVLLATVTRIDAIVPVGVLLGGFVAIWHVRHRNRRALLFAAASLVPWAIFMVWRREYFGEWSPNTAAAQAISLRGSLSLVVRAPADALLNYRAWFNHVGETLFAFQLLWLVPLAWSFRKEPVPLTRVALIIAGVFACLVQYALFGPARMDAPRTVTELALYSTAAAPFVLLGCEFFTRVHFTVGVLIMAISTALTLNAAPHRVDIGWGAPGFETIVADLDRIATAEDVPRPLIANPDLGAVSWHKKFNILDFGRLGSAVVPRAALPSLYIADVAQPDIIELHAPWSCFYGDLFNIAAIANNYVRLTSPVVNAVKCPGSTGDFPAYWVRRDIMKESSSLERRFLDRFRKTLDIRLAEEELADCLRESGPRPCGYVGRTLFRFVPELKRSGREARMAALLAADPRLHIEHAFFTSSRDPNWWKTIGLAEAKVLINPLGR